MKRAPTISSLPGRCRGFTLVELMIVVLIIAFLALLAIPTVTLMKTNARGAQFINDLRQARAIFETRALEIGAFPPDSTPGVAPAGMAQELQFVHWTRPTPIGGQWEWDHLQHGVTAGVSVYQPEFTDAQMARIDARIDDGNLSTGIFRQRAAGFIYVLQ